MMIISWGEQILSNSSRVTVHLFINFDMPLAIVSPSSFFFKDFCGVVNDYLWLVVFFVLFFCFLFFTCYLHSLPAPSQF